MRAYKAFKSASLHTKIFIIVAIGVALLTTAMSLYPYLWFDQHRSKKEVSP